MGETLQLIRQQWNLLHPAEQKRINALSFVRRYAPSLDSKLQAEVANILHMQMIRLNEECAFHRWMVQAAKDWNCNNTSLDSAHL